ncbi:ABC transporter substrate-binding protein [bacterium RCC_150]
MKRIITASALLAALVLALTACAGTNTTTGTSGTGPHARQSITVGAIPIVDVAPLYLGVDKGFFAEEGLDVKIETGQGGAAIIPGITSGTFQFAFSNITSVLLAQSKGLSLSVIAPGVFSTSNPKSDFTGILVRADSGITSAADLKGKKVAVNTLHNIADTTTRELISKAGGDPNSVEFIELALPDMAGAVERGQVDAAFSAEPFLTLSSSGTITTGIYPYSDLMKDFMPAAYFTSATYASENPETVSAFRAAIDKSLKYAQANPDEVRRILQTYTAIPQEAANSLVLPTWSTTLSTDSLELINALATKDGLLKEKVDLDKLVK